MTSVLKEGKAGRSFRGILTFQTANPYLAQSFFSSLLCRVVRNLEDRSKIRQGLSSLLLHFRSGGSTVSTVLVLGFSKLAFLSKVLIENP